MRYHRLPPSERTPSAASADDRGGFTLVELLVAVSIVLVLSSLMLSGMAVARHRAKIDRTRTTIRKIHEIVMPQYESYLRRRVPFVSGGGVKKYPLDRLVAVRQLLVYELPDSWADVRNSMSEVTDDKTGLPGFLQTGRVLSYVTTKSSLGPTVVAVENGSAESLYMIVSQGGVEPDQMEQFRSDEIGDTDNDGAPEFLDGWSRPIGFIRWAGGFSAQSPVQKADAANYHDPLDPLRVDAQGYALIPLIASAGPDGIPGITLSTGWQPADNAALKSVINDFGAPDGSGGHVDNITNHDLMKK